MLVAGNATNCNSCLSNDLIELDCDVVSKIFKRLKQKGILGQEVSYNFADFTAEIKTLSSSNEFMDLVKMHRLQQQIPMTKVAQMIGKDDESYRMYEAKYNEIQDYKIAEKIIKVLNLEGILELPDYFKIMKKYSKQSVIKIANEYGKKDFSIETNIPVSTINFWNQKNNIKKLSTGTYKKLVPFFKEHNIQY